MLDRLPELNCPAWLREMNLNTPVGFCLQSVLRDSLFYPCCQFDGDPVKFLGGNVFSFVYADLAQNSESLMEHLQCPQNMFRGYELLASQVLGAEHFLQPDGLNHQGFGPELREIENATWLIFRRLPEFGQGHGPERFSLLYVHGDGILAYEALYVQNLIQPLVMALIQPGSKNETQMAFGNDDCQLADIMGQHGFPQYFLSGGYCRDMAEQDSAWPRSYPSPALVTLPIQHQGSVSLYAVAAAAGP